MGPVPGEPYKCKFRWLLDTDLKGWIPQYIIDSALSGAQLEYIGYIRKYSVGLYDSGRVEAHMMDNGAVGGAVSGARRKIQLPVNDIAKGPGSTENV